MCFLFHTWRVEDEASETPLQSFRIRIVDVDQEYRTPLSSAPGVPRHRKEGKARDESNVRPLGDGQTLAPTSDTLNPENYCISMDFLSTWLYRMLSVDSTSQKLPDNSSHVQS